jgi:hypothetical protein
MDANEIDWTAVRAEYVTTDIGLVKLSEKYGIALATIKRRSAREGWVEERQKRKDKVVDHVMQKVIYSDARRVANRLEGLQETAEDLADLIKAEIGSAWDRRAKRLKAAEEQDVVMTDDDTKVLKDLTTALKGVTDIMRDVYAIPTIKEQIDLERWEREKTNTSGESEGGVIFLPPVMEEEVADLANDMDTTAEADRVSAEE